MWSVQNYEYKYGYKKGQVHSQIKRREVSHTLSLHTGKLNHILANSGIAILRQHKWIIKGKTFLLIFDDQPLDAENEVVVEDRVKDDCNRAEHGCCIY